MADTISDELEKLIRDRLADMSVTDIRICLDSDDAGERAYRVMVVYEAKRGALESAKTASLARYARHKLLDMDENAFPFFRFVSDKDAKALAAA
ncbi:hypothetical protein [Croceicoccus hydrothermalis]|uniref:hypothetical protein n=1 Tax=Croceicoccus hydrothermalis TaxID=2867964 RepID=UPI001EFBB2AD|nr:hypothetical protein [Croceicoccus hydrothermalis]